MRNGWEFSSVWVNGREREERTGEFFFFFLLNSSLSPFLSFVLSSCELCCQTFSSFSSELLSFFAFSFLLFRIHCEHLLISRERVQTHNSATPLANYITIQIDLQTLLRKHIAKKTNFSEHTKTHKIAEETTTSNQLSVVLSFFFSVFSIYVQVHNTACVWRCELSRGNLSQFLLGNWRFAR